VPAPTASSVELAEVVSEVDDVELTEVENVELTTTLTFSPENSLRIGSGLAKLLGTFTSSCGGILNSRRCMHSQLR